MGNPQYRPETLEKIVNWIQQGPEIICDVIADTVQLAAQQRCCEGPTIPVTAYPEEGWGADVKTEVETLREIVSTRDHRIRQLGRQVDDLEAKLASKEREIDQMATALTLIGRPLAEPLTAIVKDPHGFATKIERLIQASREEPEPVPQVDFERINSFAHGPVIDRPMIPDPEPVMAEVVEQVSLAPAEDQEGQGQAQSSVPATAPPAPEVPLQEDPKFEEAREMLRDGATYAQIKARLGLGTGITAKLKAELGLLGKRGGQAKGQPLDAPLPDGKLDRSGADAKNQSLEDRIAALIPEIQPLPEEWAIDGTDFVRIVKALAAGASHEAIENRVLPRRSYVVVAGALDRARPFAEVLKGLGSKMEEQEFVRQLGAKLREASK